jgi:DNA polymerase III epsilon subunit-like protein
MSLQILNAGKPWTQEEDALLSNLYFSEKLDLLQIAEIHKRAPGGIISRLIKNQIIPDKRSIRGYNDFLKLEETKEKTLKQPNESPKKQRSSPYADKKVIKKNVKDFSNDEITYDIDQELKMIGYSESTKKIISWLKNLKNPEITIGYLGLDFEIIQSYFEGSIKITNCEKILKQNFDIIITNHFFDTNLTPEEKVGKLKLLVNKLLNFGELIIIEQQNYHDAIQLLITDTKVVINESLPISESFFIRSIKKLNTRALSFMVLDTETSGFPLSRDPTEFEKFNGARLIELGYIMYDKSGDQVVKTYDHLIKPDNFIITNSFVHGIKQEDAIKNGKNVNEVLDQLTQDLEQIDGIICHNISFDMAIILAEAHRAKKIELIELIQKKLHLCSMALGKKFMKMEKNPKLVELYKFLFNEEFIQDHRALSDCVACAKCYFGMINFGTINDSD